MEKALKLAAEAAPSLIKNSQFAFSLAGWPAAVTLISLGWSAVAIFAIYRHFSKRPAADVIDV